MTDPNLEKKRRILSLLEQRKPTYSSISVKAVLAREQGDWKNSLTVIQALHRDEPPVTSQSHRYPNCLLSKTGITVDELGLVIEDLTTAGKLKIKDVAEVWSEGQFSQGPWDDFTASRDERFNQGWPVNVFTFEPKIRAGPPREPYVAVDAPLFPTYWELLRVWTGVDVSRYNQYAGTILFLLPNYSARIDELRLASGTLTARIRAGEASSDEIVGKLYCEKLGGPILQTDVTFKQEMAEVPVRFVPDWWQIYILSKQTGEPLDFRKVHSSWSSLPPGVVVDIGPADIEQILARGENDHVEFKRELSTKPDEFLETVVAFANTEGGSIMVGVDDNGAVAGSYEQKCEERVESMVRDNCDPQPKVSVERKEFRSKPVYVVRVPEGGEKPYNLRNKGFFIRAGSTDRLMSRIEMDNIYATRQYPQVGRRLF